MAAHRGATLSRTTSGTDDGARRGLFAQCLHILALTDPSTKVCATTDLAQAWRAGGIDLDSLTPVPPITLPGMPAGLVFVEPRDLPTRGTATADARVRLVHAVAHIEFNAIHLALDACHRFRGLPRAYYADWLGVAAEEAEHFSLLSRYLERRGARYGDHPVHRGLWSMAERSADDVLVRMALVPRVMEARGLDVTPAMRARFAAAGDDEAVAALDVILRDEIGHVAIGNRWFHWLCKERGLDADDAFEKITRAHGAPRPRPPMNREARLAAGFLADELDRWSGQ